MRGATVVVRRGAEYLVLRRVECHANGDSEWTPPAGTAEQGESAHVREADWSLFVADPPQDAQIVLSDEHDRYEWVSLDDACARCLPDLVAAGREAAA